MKLRLNPMTLHLREPFTIARGSFSERKVLILGLSAAGAEGFGEAGEHPFYGVTVEAMLEKANEVKPVVESYTFDNPGNFWAYLRSYLEGDAFLQSAFDAAAHDLYGKIARRPCRELWELPSAMPLSSYTLPLDEPEKLLRKIASSRYPIFKVKLGTAASIGAVRLLRKHTDAIIRVDANCAWTAEQAIPIAEQLASLQVEFLEQPLAADDWSGMEKLKAASPIPIIADEACRTLDDIPKCAEYFDGINIKLSKCGGPTPALRMANLARNLSLKVMGGCMIESSVGISAMAQLAPLLDFADLDGATWLANDPASGAYIAADGTIVLPDTPGLGITFTEGK